MGYPSASADGEGYRKNRPVMDESQKRKEIKRTILVGLQHPPTISFAQEVIDVHNHA